MSKSTDQSSSLFATAVKFAKKAVQTGVDTLNQMSPAVTVLEQVPNHDQVIDGIAHKPDQFEKKQYDHPQHILTDHLPKVSRQVFGRHYTRLSRMSHMMFPELNQKVADYLFDYLNDWVSQQTSVEAILSEVGAKDLVELTQDQQRSARIHFALNNQNKVIASLLGALTGVTGVVGAAIDVPTSLMLALRSIYQTGRAYGFELNVEDQAVIEYIFKQIDLGSVAEKQALLAAVRALTQTLKTHDIQQLQRLLGSANDFALLQQWLLNRPSLSQWTRTDVLSQANALSYVAKFTPFIGMSVSAVYSCHLVDDASTKAQQVFAAARTYLLEHPEPGLDPLSAYLLSQQQIETTLLTKPVENLEDNIVQDTELTEQAATDLTTQAEQAVANADENNTTL